MRTTIRHVVVLAVAALVLTATALPAQGGGGGGKDKCRVRNMTTRETSSDLQAQIDATWPGDTLKIKGVCVGNFRIPEGAKLTLLGKGRDGVQATLDAGGRGTVLYIRRNADVTLTDLTITGGVEIYGGGIYFSGEANLTLNGASEVTGNLGGLGGGIYLTDGHLLLTDSAKVTANSSDQGGGICVHGPAHVMLAQGAKVTNNEAHLGGGISNAGTLTLIGWSEVSGNKATNDHAGGIYNGNSGTLNLLGWSEVTGNTSRLDGGGIYNNNGAALMEVGSTVTGNIADADNDGDGEGGGIWGCVTGAVAGSNVYDNYLVSDEGTEDNIANGCP